MKIGIIGCGRAAKSLTSALINAKYKVVSVSDRSYKKAEKFANLFGVSDYSDDNQRVIDSSDLIFICTQDSSIERVCNEIKPGPEKKTVHISGSTGTGVFKNKEYGVMHPISSFTDSIHDLSGVTFGIMGTPKTVLALKKIVKNINGKFILIPEEDAPLYHATCCIAANYAVTLMNASCSIWEKWGYSKDEAKNALLPLLEAVVDNMKKQDIGKCLTGPRARNDTATIEKHQKAISENNDEYTRLYNIMGEETVKFALENKYITEQEAHNHNRKFKKET